MAVQKRKSSSDAFHIDSSGAAGRTATRPGRKRLRRSYESAQKFSIDLVSDGVDFNALPAEQYAGVFNPVDACRLDIDIFESGGSELRAVVVLFRGTCDAANPEQDSFANRGQHL